MKNSDLEHNEQLSALLDDELGQRESLALWAEIEHRKALSNKLHRYAVAQRVMQSGRSVLPDAGFVDRIHAAIAEEPAILVPRVVKHKVRERVMTFAMAASLATLAVIVGRSVNDYSPANRTNVLAQVALPEGDLKTAVADAEIGDYLAMHNETTYLSGAQGMLPSVRLVSGPPSR
ncbi:MAG: sigma-E factor negative regulatory protein [Methylococcaceae bacterium]|jgi:sigma-E factor negative regulatory protein RseA